MICRRLYKEFDGTNVIIYYGSRGINEGIPAEVSSILNIGDVPSSNIQYFLRVPCNLKAGFLLDGSYRYIPSTVLIDENGLSTKTYYVLSNEGKTGSTKFYNNLNKHDNFSKHIEAVKDSLIQHLSVMKGELWFSYDYGLPLLEKVKNKVIIDTSISTIINSIGDVQSLQSISSSVFNHKYSAEVIVKSIYGNLNLNI